MRRLFAFIALCIVAACAPPAPPPPSQSLKFSILSTESMASSKPDWTPLIADMQTALGRPVDAYFGPNYTVLIEAMRFKQTQAGWFGNASAIEAVDRADGEVFAVAERGGYHSYMIARANSGLTLDKVLACKKTLTYGAADPQSTSGTQSPNAFLWGPRKLDPQTCFANAKVANHEANIIAVSNSLVDLAIVDSTVYQRVAARSPDIVAKLAIIWTSPTLPDDPVVRRKDLDPDVKAKMAAFLFAYGQGEGPEADRQRAILAKIGVPRFVPSDDSHLDATRAMKVWSALVEARRGGSADAIAKAEQAVAALPAGAATPAVAPAAPAAKP